MPTAASSAAAVAEGLGVEERRGSRLGVDGRADAAAAEDAAPAAAAAERSGPGKVDRSAREGKCRCRGVEV